MVEILKLFGVGIISSLGTYFLTSRRFRHTKWWELKAAAYKDTIEALSDLIHHYHGQFEARARNQEFIGDASKDWIDCQKRIKRSAYSGAFLFSKEAELALKKCVKELDKHPDNYKYPLDYYDDKYGAAKNCLDSLVECSKKDLRLKEIFLDRS